MHADELDTSDRVLRALLEQQHPELAGLPRRPVPSTGTAHAIHRIGAELAARLPRRPGQAARVEKEARWTDRVADCLPLEVPRVHALGRPNEAYPSPWLIVDWLPGRSAEADTVPAPGPTAAALARFLRALHALPPTDGPPPGAHNLGRGEPLFERDAPTRESIAVLGHELDQARALDLWEAGLAAHDPRAKQAWIHGDLCAGNLLWRNGELAAAIDWSGLAVGDPSVDLLPAWNMFGPEQRAAFRSALEVDDATWTRGRAWALSQAAIALPYYIDTNPSIVAQSRRILRALQIERSSGQSTRRHRL